MTLSTKIIIAISAIVALCLATFIIYKQNQISQQQEAIEKQVVAQKELTDNLTRSMNQYATKQDVEQFAKDNGINLKAIQDDLKKLQANISSINAVTVVSNGYQGTNIPTDHIGPANPNPTTPTVNCNGQQIPCPNADSFDYMKKQQNISLNESFGNVKVPIGEVGFSAWQKNPWSVNLLPREYHSDSVVGTDENQRQYFYNKFSVKIDGKSYDIKIDNATTKQEFPQTGFSWWNPRLFLSTDLGYNLSENKGEFTPGINIGLMSYGGKYKSQPDFSILQLGLGWGTVSNRGQVSVTPVSYNVGKHIPLMNNLYVGPAIDLGTNGNISVMIGIRAAL